MNRPIKIALWGTAAIAALLVGLAIAVKFLLPPEKARAFVEKQLSTRLQREVKLGDVSVGLFSGLRVNDVAISEHPTFEQGRFVSGERLELRIALLPLLGRKIIVNDVTLVRPFIHIERRQDGSFNFSDLKPSSTAPASGSAGPETLVNGLSITGGRIEFVDRSTPGRSATIDALNARVGSLSMGGSIEVESDMVVAYDNRVATTSLKADVNLLRQVVDIQGIEIKHYESSILVTGTVEALLSDPLLSLKARIQPLDLSALGSTEVTGEARGTVSVRGRPSDFTFDGALNLADAVFTSTTGFSKPKGEAMTVAVNGRLENQSVLTIEPLSLGVGTVRATANGRVDAVMTSTRTFSLTLHADPFAVEEILARLPADSLPKGLSLAGKAGIDLRANGTTSSGHLDIDVTGDGLHVRQNGQFDKPAGVPLSFKGTGRYSMPTALSFEQTRITVGDMVLTGPLTYRAGPVGGWSTSLRSGAFQLAGVARLSPQAQAFKPTGTATVSVQAKATAGRDADVRGTYSLKEGSARHASTEFSGIDASGTFSPGAQKGTLRAARVLHEHFDGKDIDLTWDLTSVTADLDRISGTARLRTGGGEFRDTQRLIDGSRAARAALIPLGIVQKLDRATGGALNIPSTDRVPFTSISGDYTFRNGVMTASPFRLEAKPFNASLTGSAGLAANGKLDARATVVLPKSAIRGSVGQFLAEADGTVPLSMKVTGTVDNPVVKLDTKKVEEKIGNLLRGLLNPGQ